jgi:hypothetical protein
VEAEVPQLTYFQYVRRGISVVACSLHDGKNETRSLKKTPPTFVPRAVRMSLPARGSFEVACALIVSPLVR